eukprot:CAMPEP_0171358382 /NCGR_PEP_ID=MMETSP0878-20121228/46726_1 /TAXON_ID=67004 /ORGANISM="Thalassiosira weissflogii, Strain CCMP1336" /LENGTH=51 /DNA_ID=CAMNT_0011864449 /DNA_START=602 /DNA_END=757 /DNA_ORIENTATION=+
MGMEMTTPHAPVRSLHLLPTTWSDGGPGEQNGGNEAAIAMVYGGMSNGGRA